MMRRPARLLTLVALLAPAALVAQMPDVRMMSGVPMPSADVPPGSVSVRLVRGELTNNIVGHPVELHAGEKVDTVRTDASGRAIFSGVPAGLPLHAIATVDGERIESQTFSLPPEAGVRLVLVAGAGAASATAAAAPGSAAPGEVIFGGDSRIQIEFDDDTLEVFYLLELVNPATTPVTPKTEIVFDLPDEAQQAAMLEGSSTQGSVRGRRVSISGPFAPGVTPIQLAYSLSPAGERRTLTQAFPIAWARVQVMMTRAGAAAVSSPQFASSNEMPGQGPGFVLGVGGALAPGQALTLGFSGLPHRTRWGRNTALGLALLVLVAGAVLAWSGSARTGDEARVGRLQERRDRLMADLVRLERQARSGGIDETRYATRRAELVAQLERVHGELDQQGGPGGAGPGRPA